MTRLKILSTVAVLSLALPFVATVAVHAQAVEGGRGGAAIGAGRGGPAGGGAAMGGRPGGAGPGMGFNRAGGGGRGPGFAGGPRPGGAQFGGGPRQGAGQNFAGNGPRPGFGGGPRYGDGYRYGGYGAGLGIGLATGALASSAYYGGYGPGYYGYDDGPTYYGGDDYSDGGAVAVAPGGPDDADSCAAQFRSYDPRSGTYLGYDGQRHACP